ncbi:hypothetical protein BCR34DRAFT_15118 [Clohesyomyces aquaticus]|uniref:Uncharacterized protein n=1 Tax=Clohesyomyces aquaticus TaxID=1231657 RepID=A0A1Y1ZE29_9PLEO|nr:hypothetical protein BCR34DRAFT_15118 [Clohesyomyces aquaticus]
MTTVKTVLNLGEESPVFLLMSHPWRITFVALRQYLQCRYRASTRSCCRSLIKNPRVSTRLQAQPPCSAKRIMSLIILERMMRRRWTKLCFDSRPSPTKLWQMRSTAYRVPRRTLLRPRLLLPRSLFGLRLVSPRIRANTYMTNHSWSHRPHLKTSGGCSPRKIAWIKETMKSANEKHEQELREIHLQLANVKSQLSKRQDSPTSQEDNGSPISQDDNCMAVLVQMKEDEIRQLRAQLEAERLQSSRHSQALQSDQSKRPKTTRNDYEIQKAARKAEILVKKDQEMAALQSKLDAAEQNGELIKTLKEENDRLRGALEDAEKAAKQKAPVEELVQCQKQIQGLKEKLATEEKKSEQVGFGTMFVKPTKPWKSKTQSSRRLATAARCCAARLTSSRQMGMRDCPRRSSHASNATSTI